MKIAEIRRLIRLVEASDINELEIEEEGARIRIVKRISDDGVVPMQVAPLITSSEQASMVTPAEAAQPKISVPPPDDLVQVTSPMVGTFYRAPSPEAPSYVQVGDMVKIGQVLCIIEAMKMMNEIEADFAGTIVDICIENAQTVEFGQTMFTIRKA